MVGTHIYQYKGSLKRLLGRQLASMAPSAQQHIHSVKSNKPPKRSQLRITALAYYSV